MKRLAALALLPALAACDMPGAAPAAPMPASPTAGFAWQSGSDPVSAAFGPAGGAPVVSATCGTSRTGVPAVVWRVAQDPGAPGQGAQLGVSAGGLRANIEMVAVEEEARPGTVWRGSVAATDNSRQVVSGPSGPVTFALSTGAEIVAPNAGPLRSVYAACT